MAHTVHWILFSVGLMLLTVSIWQYQRSKNLLANGIKTKGKVTELIPIYDSDDGDYTYKPVFEFKTRQGESRTYTSLSSSRPPAYKVGELVTLVYDKDDLEHVKIESFYGLYIFSVILGCIAAPLLIIGGGYLMYFHGIL